MASALFRTRQSKMVFRAEMFIQAVHAEQRGQITALSLDFCKIFHYFNISLCSCHRAKNGIGYVKKEDDLTTNLRPIIKNISTFSIHVLYLFKNSMQLKKKRCECCRCLAKNREIVVQGATNVFTTVHSLDMKILDMDDK